MLCLCRKLEPEERVSGPGNAQEALKMREALGKLQKEGQSMVIQVIGTPFVAAACGCGYW